MHIGSPPRQPAIVFAIAKTLVSVFTLPRSPPPPNLFPLLSNYYKYKNCSNKTTALKTSAAGIRVRIS